jgi:V8-like Glu-specific endopeptidase
MRILSLGAKVVCLLPMLSVGCSAATGNDEGAEPVAESEAPSQIYMNPTGVRMRLAGKAPQRAIRHGEIQRPNALTDKPWRQRSRAELAEALRPVTLVGGRWEYVGEEPAYELADSVLSNRVEAASTPPREGRLIVGSTCGAGPGPCDNRTIAADTDTAAPFFQPTLFIEHGCSATMIDKSTAITAAHCVYNTVSDFWYVTDGSACSNTPESGANITEDRRDGTNTQNCLPRLAAGLRRTMTPLAPFGWLSCYNITIPNQYRVATSSDGEFDYAVINFNVAACSNKTPGATSGWRGTWIASASDLTSNPAAVVGYPAQAAPGQPDNSAGGDATGFPFRYAPAGCGAGAGSEASSKTPCSAATLMYHVANNAYVINPFLIFPWQLGTPVIDTSGGQSGSGILLLRTTTPTTGSPTAPSNVSNVYLIGTHSAGAPVPLFGTYNVGHRWDTTVRTFVSTNSSFPNL